MKIFKHFIQMKNLKNLFNLLLAIVIITGSCKQPDLNVETSIEVPVGVIEASSSSIEEFINTTGTVLPLMEVSLSSEITGKYHLHHNSATGRPYALGDKVKMGVTIIKLEDEEYVNNLRTKSKEVDLEISRQEYDKQKEYVHRIIYY